MDRLRIRPARRDESPAIAGLFLMSSDGLAEYIWQRLAEPGEDLAAVGARRYARDGVAFSYRNCLIAEAAGAAIGMIHCFPMAAPEPAAAPAAPPDPVLRPYAELEDYGSLYVSGLAVEPRWRNRGIGTRLLEAAEERARPRPGAALAHLLRAERGRDAALPAGGVSGNRSPGGGRAPDAASCRRRCGAAGSSRALGRARPARPRSRQLRFLAIQLPSRTEPTSMAKNTRAT